MTPTEFLHELWGPDAPGLVHLWDGTTKQSAYLSPGSPTAPEGARDLYTGVGLAPRDLGPTRRPRANQVCAIAGMWLDLDIAPDRCPTVMAAMQLAMSHAEPTIVVSSGTGLHAWHLLDDGPYPINSPAARRNVAILADAWNAAHSTTAQENGWGRLDRTHDLARLLRVPGTLNAKTTPPKPVEALTTGGPRHHLHGLEASVRDHIPAATRHDERTNPSGTVTKITTTGEATVDPATLGAMLANSAEFAKSWHRQGPRAWGQSEYDLSLAAWCVQADLDDQEIVNLLRHHRLQNPDTTRHPKAQRASYYQATLRRARSKVADDAENTARQARVQELGRMLGSPLADK